MITQADLIAARERKDNAQAYYDSLRDTSMKFTEAEAQVRYDVEVRAALRASAHADVEYDALLDQYLQQESEGATL